MAVQKTDRFLYIEIVRLKFLVTTAAVTAAALSLTGCMTMLWLSSLSTSVTVYAMDGDYYDFYMDGALKCSNTNKCSVNVYDNDECKVLFEARREDIVYGEEKYGSGWDEKPFLVSLFLNNHDDEQKHKCSGSDAVIYVNPDMKKENDRTLAKRKRVSEGRSSDLFDGEGSAWDRPPKSK